MIAKFKAMPITVKLSFLFFVVVFAGLVYMSPLIMGLIAISLLTFACAFRLVVYLIEGK